MFLAKTNFIIYQRKDCIRTNLVRLKIHLEREYINSPLKQIYAQVLLLCLKLSTVNLITRDFNKA